ncbi:unnamed protein product, partial [Ectocarpus fasciculatus]
PRLHQSARLHEERTQASERNSTTRTSVSSSTKPRVEKTGTFSYGGTRPCQHPKLQLLGCLSLEVDSPRARCCILLLCFQTFPYTGGIIKIMSFTTYSVHEARCDGTTYSDSAIPYKRHIPRPPRP